MGKETLPMMSIRAKVHLLIFVAWPVGGLGLSLLGMLHPMLVFLVFPYALLISSLGQRIRCSTCDIPVLWHTYRLLGRRLFEWWSPLAPRRCEHCGHDLTGKERRTEG